MSKHTPDPFWVVCTERGPHQEFVEIETAERRSVKRGTWEKRNDGYWQLGPFRAAEEIDELQEEIDELQEGIEATRSDKLLTLAAIEQRHRAEVEQLLAACEDLQHLDSHGCCSGDCPHRRIGDCVTALSDALSEASEVARVAIAKARGE